MCSKPSCKRAMQLSQQFSTLSEDLFIMSYIVFVHCWLNRSVSLQTLWMYQQVLATWALKWVSGSPAVSLIAYWVLGCKWPEIRTLL